MNISAAVMTELGEPLSVEELDLAEPKRDEVLVRVLATGICRSDLSLMKGYWPVPLPMVLGHEGAGIIESVGEGVDSARVGESVVLTFAPSCGRCRFCLEGRVNVCAEAMAAFETGLLRDGTTRLRRNGQPVYHLAFVSSFASHAVVPANAAIPVSPALDPTLSCLLGCGVMAGLLSVTKRARVHPGESVAIFGCGGVGLSAVLGAKLVSAHPIVAVDPVASKRELALSIGATHAVDPAEGPPAAAIRSIVAEGVDYAIEAIGKAEVAEQAFDAVRQGGTTVLVGQPAVGVRAGVPVYELTQFEQSVLGSNLGGASPALDVPKLARLLEAGTLDLAPLVSHRWRLRDINEALGLVESGDAARVVVDLRDEIPPG